MSDMEDVFHNLTFQNKALKNKTLEGMFEGS